MFDGAPKLPPPNRYNHYINIGLIPLGLFCHS